MGLSQAVTTADPHEYWFALIAVSVAALASFYLAFRFLRRLRIVQDTPTARIRSAPQGYGEFEGSARLMPGESILSPLTQRDCVWYSYRVEERRTSHHHGKTRTHWHTIDSETSEALFLIVDETGQAIVDPDHAEVTPSVHRVWYGSRRFPGRDPQGFWHRFFAFGRYRYTEKRIHEHDPLYVMGLFTSVSEAEQASYHDDVSALLRSWKADPARLKHRFDHNRDGHVDADEWDEARQQARRQITRERQSIQANTHTHVICKPFHNHQPFLLAATSQDRMIQNFRLKTIAALGGFFAAGAFAVWMVNVR